MLFGFARKHVNMVFASVCLNTTWISLAKKLLSGTSVKPIAVVGFPLGAMVSAAKAAETRQAIADGAQEIDMVINIGALKGGDHDLVYRDIHAVVEAAQGFPVKGILETAMLSREENSGLCSFKSSQCSLCQNKYRFWRRRSNCGRRRAYAKYSRARNGCKSFWRSPVVWRCAKDDFCRCD